MTIKLVKKAQKGDDKAFQALFQLYEQDIYRTAYVYLKNQHDALDAVQETAYKTFKNIKHLKNPEYFKTWIIRITINCALDILKKSKRIIPSHEFYTGQIEAFDEAVLLRLTINEVLEELDEVEKGIVLMKYYYEYTFMEIGEILDLPTGTVKSVLYRCLKKIRENKEGRI